MANESTVICVPNAAAAGNGDLIPYTGSYLSKLLANRLVNRFLRHSTATSATARDLRAIGPRH